MILARENVGINYAFAPEVAPRVRRKRVRKQDLTPVLTFTIILVVAFGLAILLTARYAYIAQLGYKMSQIKKEIATMQANNERLQLEVEKLSSLSRIETTATTKLGMVYPEKIQYLSNEIPSASLKVAQQENHSQAPVQVNEGQPVLQDLADFLATLFKSKPQS